MEQDKESKKKEREERIKEQAKEDVEYNKRLNSATSMDERNQIIRERTIKRMERMTGHKIDEKEYIAKGKRDYNYPPPQSTSKNIQPSNIQSSKKENVLKTTNVIPSVDEESEFIKSITQEEIKESRSQPSIITNVIRTPEESLSNISEEERILSPALTQDTSQFVNSDKRNPSKDYIWMPTVDKYLEYNKEQKVRVYNVETKKDNVVTMEQLRYLYTPTETGFIRVKRSTNYIKQNIETDSSGNFQARTQLRKTQKFKMHGKEYIVEGYSTVSDGRKSYQEAQRESNIRVKAKIIYMMQLMREGYDEESAYKIALESPPLDNIDENTALPNDVEMEEYREEQLQYVGGEEE